MLITIAQVVAIQHDTASDGSQGDTSDQTNERLIYRNQEVKQGGETDQFNECPQAKVAP